MKPFSKTYYVKNLHVTIRIKRDEIHSHGCRLTIKRKLKKRKYSMGVHQRSILYTIFHNDKNLFENYERKMIECKVPKKTIKEIIKDIRTNLMFEKVVTHTYQPITNNIFSFI